MPYIKQFDGLRGLMALWVILGHYYATTSIALPHVPATLANTHAVSIFIILSGFAITSLLDRKKEHYGSYIVRRLFRIFPVYWFYLAISILLLGVSYSVWGTANFGSAHVSRAEIAAAAIDHFWTNILIHIPALQSALPNRISPPLGSFAFLGQAWSISLEWQFYLVAPFAISTLISATAKWRLAGSVVIVAVGLLIASRIMPTGFIGKYLDKFALGIASYYFIKWAVSKELNSNLIAAWTILLVGFLVCVMGRASLPFIVWAVVVGSVVVQGVGPLSFVSGTLNSKYIQAIGKMSYSVYLSHMIPLTLGMLVLRELDIEAGVLHAAALLAFTLVGTFSLSTFSYVVIEKPFQGMGKRLATSLSLVEGSAG